MTGYLATTYGITPFPKLWAEHLSTVLSKDEPSEIVDLGSGSGGPIALVLKELEAAGFRTRVTLTDLFPNPNGAPGNASMRYWPEPVDATRVSAELTGTRTMFAAFHHFRPQAAREILRGALNQRRAICIFEATSRTPGAILSTLLIPILVLVMTPRVRPLSWIQIVFTYPIPILPLLMFWDGLVSQLRTYSTEELKDLTRDLQSPAYRWEIGQIQVPRHARGRSLSDWSSAHYAMNAEFRKAVLPDELRSLLLFDAKVFPKADRFPKEQWLSYDSYWLIVDGVRVGCCAFERNAKPGGKRCTSLPPASCRAFKAWVSGRC